MKKLVAACIDLKLVFDSGCEVDTYLYKLDKRHINYRVVSLALIDGKHHIRIKRAYNSSPLLLSEGDKDVFTGSI